MYTSESKLFSDQFKAFATTKIEEMTNRLSFQDLSNILISKGYHPNTAMAAVEGGRRWNNSEEVFQAMVMIMSDNLRAERGPGFMTEAEAKGLEKTLMKTMSYGRMMTLASDAIAQSLDTDYHYIFEKEY